MKKDKKAKLSNNEKTNIAFFKQYFNDYFAKSTDLQSLDFEDINQQGLYKCAAVLNYGFVIQRVYYYPYHFIYSDFIDTSFKYNNCKYEYSLYDIFNLFEIDDFNLYYHYECIASAEIKIALDNIMAAVKRHLYYIEKAGSDGYFSQLEANYETDRNTVFGDDSWKEDIEDPFLIDFAHPLMSFADGQINDKMVKKLKSKSNKGKLDTIYEKRLLKHLENGGNVQRDSISDKSKFNKKYTKYKALAYTTLTAASFVFIYAAVFLVRSIVFSGAQLVYDELHVFGMSLKDSLVFPILPSITLSVFLTIIFGKKATVAYTPVKEKERVRQRYYSEASGNRLHKKISKILGCVIAGSITIFGYTAAVSGAAFYDDYIKISDGLLLETKISYSDMLIYNVKGFYDENEDFFEYDNKMIAVSNGSEYYVIGEVTELNNTDKKIREIVDEYNKEIMEVNSIEELE